MSRTAAAFLPMALICSPHSAAQDSPAMKPNLGIIGGKPVMKGEYSFVVALRDTRDKRVFCTGQIVGDYWVLTAKHCLDGTIRPKDAPFVVRTGRNMTEGKDFSSNQVFFNTDKLDVALIKLNEKITSNSVVSIPLRQGYPPAPGTRFTAVGWGLVRSTDIRGANDLQKLDDLTLDRCEQQAHICGIFPENGAKRTAKGDSGGPAVYEQYEQYGSLVSLGVLVGVLPSTPNKVDYVRADGFNQWLKETMRKK
ncbi:trypsin-like serine protease [Herbaspirillum sp. WKF16]|uniref:S1 family peptidase n=1 Tax=Herbaspirillum sp. WKF16 TaxID=3028312 RepID=UPI0023AA1226|nr:trypsin-like serine protease [Herbaspirillum sp. WKF16]WDZ98357.1 trypsin-like serine protease [Herbaspirillum sp. WKF16]